MRTFLKDPLAHFLAAGLLLFIIASMIKPPPAGEQKIIVDRAAMLEFVQYRSKAFEPQAAAALFDSLDDAGRAQLVEDFVREEAMAREAASLGLDANDYVIRQRMVQKIEFLAEAASIPEDPSKADLEAYYAANLDRYSSPPSATMTHVFISAEKRSETEAKAEAERVLNALRRQNASFNDATRYGDRFLFHKNYVDRTDDYIKSQLGDDVAAAIFDPSTPLNAWRGPFKSAYGEHLIFVAARAPARTPPLAEIANIVREDLAEEEKREATETAIAGIVAKYKIENRLVADK